MYECSTTSVVNITFSFFRPQWHCLKYKLDDSTCFFLCRYSSVGVICDVVCSELSVRKHNRATTAVSEYMRAEN